MRFNPTRLAGAFLIEPTPHRDERGVFARTFCTAEFAEHGLETSFPQHSLSVSTLAGTLRGIHFQRPPHTEVKVVRCISGALFDVIVDLRRGSPTFGQWQGFELSAANGHQVYVPEGFAHGHQTLTDEASIFYLISKPFAPGSAAGIRYDDPSLAIPWPAPITVIGDADQAWPRLDELSLT